MIVNTSAQSGVRISPETAAAFGLGADATPDDVLDILKAGVLYKTIGKYTKYSTAGALPVGATLSLNVNGEAREFLVVHQGKPSDIYDDSCDGTWLLMKDIYEKRVWDSSGTNEYKDSSIYTYLDNTFLNLLDASTRNAIKQVKIPYYTGDNYGNGTVQSGANGLSCKVFLLSFREVKGDTTSDSFADDGAALDYFVTSSNCIAYYNSEATSWYLRSKCLGVSLPYVVSVDSSGTTLGNSVSSLYGIRPAFVLSSDFACEVYTDSNGNVVPEQEYIMTLSNVLGNAISVGPKIAIGSYVGTGTYGAANPNSLTFDFAPKMVMVFKQASLRGGNVGSLGSSNASYSCFVQLMDLLTTEYVAGHGFGYRSNYSLMGKKSADGKTISWYSADSAECQYNASSVYNVYSYIAFG